MIGPALLSAVGTSVALHALWDLQPAEGAVGLLWYVGVGAIGIWLLRRSARRGVAESARSALALNPELAAAPSDAPRVTCRVCGQTSLAGSHYCVRCGSALRG